MRTAWTNLTDQQLLAQCEVDTYRASGPGGQKRNKTSSAVRIRHPPSGLMVIAEESRSQHQNRAKALERLRQAFFLWIREDIAQSDLRLDALEVREGYRAARDKHGRLDLGKRDVRFWPAVGVVLDVLQAHEARVSEAAKTLGVSTANLLTFLQTSPKVWEQANILRARFGHKPLRDS
ncbi:MAG TPA: peptide chain release factor-like protein [Gemmataceae bacterium]|nr:peptide chain release factor-like protein [Gemmataceae bacterium]